MKRILVMICQKRKYISVEEQRIMMILPLMMELVKNQKEVESKILVLYHIKILKVMLLRLNQI